MIQDCLANQLSLMKIWFDLCVVNCKLLTKYMCSFDMIKVVCLLDIYVVYLPQSATVS